MAFIPKLNRLEREACKASIMIEGLTGSGKSGAALMFAVGLTGGFRTDVTDEEYDALWDSIVTADTENRSLNLFVGLPGSFGRKYGSPQGAQITSEDGYRPSNYLAIRDEAKKANAQVIINDSITHMWTAKGGILDMVGEAKANDKYLDNYRVWGLPEISEEKQKLIDVVRDDKIHVITTVRVKEKFTMELDEAKGKHKVVSLGEQQLQQDGLKYEPDLVIRMTRAGGVQLNGDVIHPKFLVIKTRYPMFIKDNEYELTQELCESLRQYLNEGVSIDVLLERQRADYAQAVKEILDNSEAKKRIWKILKTDAGLDEKTKLEEIPLHIIKQLHTQLGG